MIENFVKKTASELEARVTQHEPSRMEREKICESLGLSSQTLLSNDLNPAEVYPELSRYEVAVWDYYLPSVYSKISGDWAKYHFDMLPTEVLEAAEMANGLHLFTNIEIWTPEKSTHPDPVMVGILGPRTRRRSDWIGKKQEMGVTRTSDNHARFFLIARWGESLVPFEQIEKEFVASKIRDGEGLSPQAKDALVNVFREKFSEGLGFQIIAGRIFTFKRHCGVRRSIVQTLRDGRELFRICPSCGDLETVS